jgi:MFS family permease
VYCDCTRDGVTQSVAAAFTAGDADQLMVGRNGVFYDRQGRDWGATITKIVEHPISLRQAFWSPYKRLARFISEQLQKFAANKSKAADDKLASAATESGKKVAQVSAAPAAAAVAPAPFDVAKFAGIFAAIGLALGAIGSALASVLSSFFSLVWWQWPIALVGLMLAISGPAVVLAWFKLRSRNLGPLLDANGWAINARAKINIPFGTSLTQVAQLPESAERTLTDPYAERGQPWGLYLVFLAIVLLGAFAWVARGHWL